MVFKSFGEVADYLQKSINNLEVITDKSVDAVGAYLVDAVKDKHGVKQSGRPKGSNPTPLVKTGELRDSVTYKKGKDNVIVYTKKNRLATIHEYGITYKMSDKQRRFLFGVVFKDKKSGGGGGSGGEKGYITIPARPIWRNVLQTERKAVQSLLDELLEGVFT